MPSYGRGGTGNIQAVAQENERIAADLEANGAAAQSERTSRAASAIEEREQQQYARTGRGGAGNFYDANEMKDVQLSDLTSGDVSLPHDSTRPAGRGGAGNFGFVAGAKEQQALTERAKEEQTKKRLMQGIEKDVDEQLAIPPRAKLAQGQAYPG